MTGLEAAAAVGKVVASRAGREWLAARSAASDRSKDLTELIRVSFPDRFARRKLERQLADIADSVEKRLTPLVEQEYGGLSDPDRAAVLAEVETALAQVDLSDETLFAVDADPVRLARRVRGLVPTPRGQLGEAGERLYDVALDECCDCLVRVVLSLSEFTPRALAEVLSRLSDLGDQVAVALDRIPARSLDAPSGTQDDAEFERRYLEHLAKTLDEIEVFGLRAENYRPRATLSVAYISLTATAEDRRREDVGPLKTAALTGDRRQEREPATTHVEEMLARSARTLLRGQAGSGKSTLLGWLTVTAARGAFTGDLADWNGRVPFLVKLRSFAETGLPQPEDFVRGPLQALMPAGWVHRVLDGGRGVLLVDGVDEVSYGRREPVRQWLRDLLAAYPKLRAVVTSRPAAADTRWLATEGFHPMMMEPMTPDSLKELVRQWHVAVRHAGSLPCEPEELPAYEGNLLARLESGPHLRALATTPLLAAMLCALNLDHVTHLPRDRMGLYRAVLDLLLERRDVQRGIRSHPGVELEREQKERLLQELAWRLTILGRSELSKATALRRVEEKAEAMPRVTASAEEILDYLLQRSGVIREPAPGRIDFVHRTVQEYLAARQSADDADMETLVAKAHLDQWRETVVMAAGHANAPLRRELLTGLLRRIESEPKRAHRLRLLVSACLETIPDVPSAAREGVDRCVAKLIPPRNDADARRLATGGEEVLGRLPESLEDLSEAQAVATVRTAWLVNGPAAMDVLARYATDPRAKVQRELVDAWSYFDPHAYAEKVLADAPLMSGRLTIKDPTLYPALRHLRRLEDLTVFLPEGESLDHLRALPPVAGIVAHGLQPRSLAALVEYPSLKRVDLHVSGIVDDVSPLLALPELEELMLRPSGFGRDLEFVTSLPRLSVLVLRGLEAVRDFSPVAEQRDLTILDLGMCPRLTDLDVLGSSGRLRSLRLGAALDGDGCARIAAAFPELGSLCLLDSPWVETLDGLAGLRLSVLLVLGVVRLTDLAPIAGFPELGVLNLNGIPSPDLTPLSRLPRLRHLLLTSPDACDLAPLAPLRNLRISLRERQRVWGIDRLHKSTRVDRYS